MGQKATTTSTLKKNEIREYMQMTHCMLKVYNVAYEFELIVIVLL